MTSSAASIRMVVLVRRVAAEHEGHGLLGHCEQAALAAALRLRDQLGGTLTAVALGTAGHEEPVLQAALDAGCDRALRVDAPGQTSSLRPGRSLGYLAVATVLSAAVRRLGCDLLLCGDRGQDQGHGVIGPAVAELLGMPHLTGVLDARLDEAWIAAKGTGELALTAQQRSSGRLHRFRCRLPVVLCMLGAAQSAAGGALANRGAQEPRARAAADTARPRIEELGLGALDVDPGLLGSGASEPDAEPAQRAQLAQRSAADSHGSQAVMATSPADLVTRLVADHVLR